MLRTLINLSLNNILIRDMGIIIPASSQKNLNQEEIILSEKSVDLLTLIDSNSIAVHNGINTLSILEAKNVLKGKESFVFSATFDIDNVTSSTEFTVVGRVPFRGTNVMTTPYKIFCVGKTNGTAEVRLFDLTNNKIICLKSGIVNTTPDLIDLGTFSNLSQERSIIEIQARVSSLLTNVTIESLTFNW